MRSILSTTALVTVLVSVAAVLPQAAMADGYDSPRTSAAQINRVINSGSGYSGGGYRHVAPRYHGGYRSHHGHQARYTGHVRSHDDYGYDHDVTDLDDFSSDTGHDGRLIASYRTYSPFSTVATDSALDEDTHGMQAEMAGPEPRSDVGRPILFASGSHGLSMTASTELDRIGNILLAYAETDIRILISAYTDATGTRDQNEAISKHRIETVKTYLTDKFDIPADRFVDAPIGEATAPGVEDPNAPENRRVVISLLGLDLDKGSDRPVASADHPIPTSKARYRSADTADRGTCSVPAYPYAGYRVAGRIIAVGFQDLDDFGGGRLIEVCKVDN